MGTVASCICVIPIQNIPSGEGFVNDVKASKYTVRKMKDDDRSVIAQVFQHDSTPHNLHILRQLQCVANYQLSSENIRPDLSKSNSTVDDSSPYQ